MLRKLVVIGLSMSALSVQAGNFYVGAGLGPDTGEIRQNAHIMQPGNFNAFDKEQHGARGIFGSIFAGYRCFYQAFVGAIEVNANLSTLKFEGSNDELIHQTFSNTSMRINYNYGLSFLPGYQYTDYLMFYGRLAWARGHFRVKTTDISLANVSSMVNGFRFGLGAQVALPCNFALRLEWNHINYRSKSIDTLDPLSSVSKHTTFSPQTNQFEFGLVYEFV